MSAAGREGRLAARPRFSEVLVVLAPMLVEFVLYLAPDPSLPHGQYWEDVVAQASFASAALAVAFSGRSS